MEIEDSPIFQDIMEIIKDGPKPISFRWKAKIHVKDDQFEAVKVLDYDIVRNYSKSFADEVTVRLLIPLGLWAKFIYPNRTILEITMIRDPLIEATDEEDTKKEIIKTRYKAVPVIGEGLPVLTGKNVNMADFEALNSRDIYSIEFQLIDKAVEKIRTVTVGNNFRRTTAADMVRAVLSVETKKLKVDDEKSILDGVDLVEPDNKEKREHLIVRQGTLLVDICNYAQDYLGGIYNSGINCYYQNKFWFIYPLFNTARFEKAKKTAVILKVPKSRYTGMERTYRKDGDTVYIVGTSESSFSDDAGTNFMNNGGGTRFSEARRYMRDIIKKRDNKAVIKRNKVNHEYLFQKGKEEEKPIINVQLSNSPVNSNPFREFTSLTSQYGIQYEIDWENADPSILFPGMMIKIHYMDKKEMRELHGVLLFVFVNTAIDGQGLSASKHITNCKLIIYCNKPPKSDEKQENDEPDSKDKEAIQRWIDFQSI